MSAGSAGVNEFGQGVTEPMQTLKKTAVTLYAAAAFAALGVTAGAPAVQAQSSYSNSDSSRVVLNPGTVIPVVLNDELTSRDSTAGDTFTATVDTSRAVYNRMLNGAVVDGEVVDATAQSGKDPGTLSLRFTKLRLANGETFSISGTPTSLDSKNVKLRSDGTLESKTSKNGKNQSLTYAGIGAGAGLLLDVLKGGKLNLGDILIGGGLGYGAGELLKNKDQKVHDVELKSGTQMGVVLGKRLLFHRHNATNVYTHTPPAEPQSNKRYYSYQGHPYYLDLNTGERVKLD
jgi:hypothetical protein